MVAKRNAAAFTLIDYVNNEATNLMYADVMTVVVIDDTGHEIASLPRGFLPHWSPDGSEISFLGDFTVNEAEWGGIPSIYEFSSRSARAILPPTNTMDSPRWSPDGSQLAYYDDNSVYVLSGDGGGARQVVSGDRLTYYWGMAWLGNGNIVIFRKSDDDNSQSYAVIDVNAGTQTTVPIPPASATPPAICAPGREAQPGDNQPVWITGTLEFAWPALCPDGIRIADTSGQAATKIIDTPAFRNRLEVSPDGRFILVSGWSGLGIGPQPSGPRGFNSPAYIVDVGSGAAEQIGGDWVADAAWRP